MTKIAVFGATGQTGRLICQLLLEDNNFELIACARTAVKLAELQVSLGDAAERLTTRAIDLHQGAEVDQVLEEADLIVGATSQWQDGLALAARAAEASTHYCGTYLSNAEKWNQLRALEPICLKHQTMIVDDCGTHPGLPAAMVRWMALRTPLHSAWVGGKFDLEWNRLGLPTETVSDFLSEIESTDPALYVDGRLKRGFRHTRKFRFQGIQGYDTCMPMLIEEIRELAHSETVASTGFFIAGFSPFVDYVIIPFSMFLTRINREASRNLFWWGLQRFASRPRFAQLLLEAEAEGSGNNVRLVVSHEDPYFITAAPVVETIRQMLSAPKPGVWTQGMFVEPVAFFDSLQQMGIDVDAHL